MPSGQSSSPRLGQWGGDIRIGQNLSEDITARWFVTTGAAIECRLYRKDGQYCGGTASTVDGALRRSFAAWADVLKDEL